MRGHDEGHQRGELATTVTLDLASAMGTIADIRCPGTKELDIDVASQLLTASIGITAVIKSGATTLASFPLSVLAVDAQLPTPPPTS